MFGDVILVGEKRPYPTQLEDAFAAIQHGQFVDAHQLLSEFLVVQTVGNLTASAFPGVEGYNNFLTCLKDQLYLDKYLTRHVNVA